MYLDLMTLNKEKQEIISKLLKILDNKKKNTILLDQLNSLLFLEGKVNRILISKELMKGY